MKNPFKKEEEPKQEIPHAETQSYNSGIQYAINITANQRDLYKAINPKSNEVLVLNALLELLEKSKL